MFTGSFRLCRVIDHCFRMKHVCRFAYICVLAQVRCLSICVSNEDYSRYDGEFFVNLMHNTRSTEPTRNDGRPAFKATLTDLLCQAMGTNQDTVLFATRIARKALPLNIGFCLDLILGLYVARTHPYSRCSGLGRSCSLPMSEKRASAVSLAARPSWWAHDVCNKSAFHRVAD